MMMTLIYHYIGIGLVLIYRVNGENQCMDECDIHATQSEYDACMKACSDRLRTTTEKTTKQGKK